jgi:hypothetical protein
MSEPTSIYEVPPMHNVKKCLRCGSELTWDDDGTLIHIGLKRGRSEVALCMETQMKTLGAQIDELRAHAKEQSEYFAAAMAFIQEQGLTLEPANLMGYVMDIRQRNSK